MRVKFQGHEPRIAPRSSRSIASFFASRPATSRDCGQYRLERKWIDIDVAADRKTARVNADYVESHAVLRTRHDARDARQLFTSSGSVETRTNESVVGLESGDLVFLSTNSQSSQSLIAKSAVSLPYD